MYNISLSGNAFSGSYCLHSNDSMIGCWQYDRLSVRLSVTLCIVALKVGVGVESCTIVFLGRHFLFTSSDIFAVGCTFSHNTQ